MEWSKLKNIVLILLIMTNLCLVGFLGHQHWESRRQEQQARSQAIEFLRSKHITLDPGAVPQEMELRPMQAERDSTLEEQGARALLGHDCVPEDKGAEVYRYHSPRGSIQFHSDGAFSGEFAPGAFPLGEDREQACTELLKKLDFHGVLVKDRGRELVFRENREDMPIFNQTVTLVCEDNAVVAMTGGRRLTGRPVPDESRETVTVATALFGFYNGLGVLGDVCSRVDSIDRGYISAASLTGPMLLTPVWRINTDTGSYQLDLMTAALTRLN